MQLLHKVHEDGKKGLIRGPIAGGEPPTDPADDTDRSAVLSTTKKVDREADRVGTELAEEQMDDAGGLDAALSRHRICQPSPSRGKGGRSF